MNKKIAFTSLILLGACNSNTQTPEAIEEATTTLSLSESTLALSVTGLTEYGVSGTPSSGVARVLTLTNTGTNTAENLSVTAPTWPSGTIHFSTCGASLVAGASCTITITPGATASSDGTDPCSVGTTPLASTLSVVADNSNTVTADIYILSYGCIYQGGHVYFLDDSVSSNLSVAGKVLTTSDQAPAFPNGIIWSSDGDSGGQADVAYDSIYGTSIISTSSSANPNVGQVVGQNACDGKTDGSCNTNNIYTYYQNHSANAPINLAFYAAGLCKQTISSFSDWYLPALCELGYGAGTGCGSSLAPTLQNVQSSLVDFNALNLVDGFYSSSTSYDVAPLTEIYYQFFATGGGAFQDFGSKNLALGVRCSRSF